MLVHILLIYFKIKYLFSSGGFVKFIVSSLLGGGCGIVVGWKWLLICRWSSSIQLVHVNLLTIVLAVESTPHSQEYVCGFVSQLSLWLTWDCVDSKRVVNVCCYCCRDL